MEKDNTQRYENPLPIHKVLASVALLKPEGSGIIANEKLKFGGFRAFPKNYES